MYSGVYRISLAYARRMRNQPLADYKHVIKNNLHIRFRPFPAEISEIMYDLITSYYYVRE